MTPPLAGIRVIDMSRVMAGPFAAVQLGDLGAEVVKVEVGPIGDVLRYWPGQSRGGFNAMFCALNRGKRSVTVDLDDPQGTAKVQELAAGADIFIESSRPGAMAALGLGPADLRTAHSELIYVSISGYGSDSPAAAEPAYDTVIQARSGMAARQRGDGTGPQVINSYVIDKLTGTFAAQAALAALVARAAGAGGQHVQVPMMDTALYYLWPDVLCDQTLVGDGVMPGPMPTSQLRLTETADGHLAYLAIAPKELAGLHRAIGRPELDDDRSFSLRGLADPDNRRAHEAIVQGFFARTSTSEAVARLKAEGVPASAVVDPADLLSDPHVAGTDVLVEWDDPLAGPIRVARHPARFSATPTSPTPTLPVLGGDDDVEHPVRVRS